MFHRYVGVRFVHNPGIAETLNTSDEGETCGLLPVVARVRQKRSKRVFGWRNDTETPTCFALPLRPDLPGRLPACPAPCCQVGQSCRTLPCPPSL